MQCVSWYLEFVEKVPTTYLEKTCSVFGGTRILFLRYPKDFYWYPCFQSLHRFEPNLKRWFPRTGGPGRLNLISIYLVPT